MMRGAAWSVLFWVTALSCGCGVSGIGHTPDVVLKATGEAACGWRVASEGKVAGSLQATAWGFAAESAETSARQILTATEAARLRAIAALATRLHGVHVTKQTQVDDLRFAGESVEARTQGHLTEVRIVKSRWDPVEKMAEVTVAFGAAGEPAEAGRQQVEQRACAAARAELRRKLGAVKVTERTRLASLALSHPRAADLMAEVARTVRLEEARWHKDGRCVVAGWLTLSGSRLRELRAVAQSPQAKYAHDTVLMHRNLEVEE